MDEKKGPPAPDGEAAPATGSGDGTPSTEPTTPEKHDDATPATNGDVAPPEETVSYQQTTDDPYGSNYGEDPYAYETAPQATEASTPAPVAVAVPQSGGSMTPPPPPSPPVEEEDPDEHGMLRMSFLEHLEELRSRILKALMGVGIAFVASLYFADTLWKAVQTPIEEVLRGMGITVPLIQIDPMEAFSILWVKLPILAAVFVSSPWILYQVWAFIAPGLYKRERKWAAPFVIASAGLFVAGGAFAYFLAFRFALGFLLGIGLGKGIQPSITVSNYFDLFINVMLGVGLIFEMPVLIFLLTLVRVVTPKFLMANSRYAILIIVIIAAIITPTPDVFNLMLFATPMCLLFYVGIFASYLLVLSREKQKFPWGKVLRWVGIVALVIAGVIYFAVTKYGYHFELRWPFLIR